MWLQVESFSSSPHGRGSAASNAHVEGALSLSDSVTLPTGHAESSPQPVHAFLFRQNAPQQQSSIWTVCDAAVDKASKSAKTFIPNHDNKEFSWRIPVFELRGIFQPNDAVSGIVQQTLVSSPLPKVRGSLQAFPVGGRSPPLPALEWFLWEYTPQGYMFYIRRLEMAKTASMQMRYLDDQAKQSLIRRINRAGGQVNGLRKMVEEADCVDKLLIQISAAKSALTQVAMELMEGHLVNCTET